MSGSMCPNTVLLYAGRFYAYRPNNVTLMYDKFNLWAHEQVEKDRLVKEYRESTKGA